MSRLTVTIVLLFGFIPMAHGHAFGQRYDLPIPLGYYLSGAAGTVFVSFILIALFSKTPVSNTSGYPRICMQHYRWAGYLSDPRLLLILQGIAALVFVLTLVAGLIGIQNPTQNILPTMVWIIWWTGMAYFCALVGNLWSVVNPWDSLFIGARYIFRRLTSQRYDLSLHWRYPAWLGVWPACVLFVIFVWGELIWKSNAIPEKLALAVIGYSLITWSGMYLYGRKTWLQNGEIFTLFFGLLARFSPFESLSLRPFGAGLLVANRVSTSMMGFVVLMLSTVTFDGFMGTPLWATILQGLPEWRALQPILFRMEMWGVYRETVITTAALILFPLLFAGLYLTFIAMMKVLVPFVEHDQETRLEKRLSTVQLGAYFVLSLVPIALAYHFAHYFSFLLTVGQMLIPLVSDPFGLQWDLFGTADYRIDIAIVGARFVWFSSVLSIVLGHVIAVYLAHVQALRALRNTKNALISQLPMVMLMIFYTTLSLWILAQPLIE